MSQPTATPDVTDLFQAAKEDGVLSPASMKALQIVDIGAQIQDALGTPVEDVASSEVVLVTMMIDDSSSIRFGRNTKAVREGHNQVLDALAVSKQIDSMLVHTRYLNGRVLFPYSPLAQAPKMDRKNYSPSGGTPLYDEAVVLLGTVLAKSQAFADNGVPVRTVTLIVTDGDDTTSHAANAAKVSTLVRDMLRQETHIVAAMGVNDGSTDFRIVFKAMGIRDDWILTPNNTASDIRKAFEVFSQSAVRASQGAAGFGQAVIGGFSNN